MSRRSTVLTHRVDEYAVRVHERDIVAGPYVRLACERHIRDRMKAATKAGHSKGLFFHPGAADHIIEFFEETLYLPDEKDEDGIKSGDEHGDPLPFILTPANTFIVGSLFGWRQRSGYRRFREAYIEMGKGNAKTPLAAGMGLYGLVLDGEQAPEIYSVATGIEQARICWRDADRMVTNTPELRDLIHQTRDNLAYAANFGWFRPLSREKKGKSGPRPHMGFFDELHEYADAVNINKVRAGAKRRKQPLFVAITNSGFDRTSICWQHHEHARKVVEQTVEDEQLFSYVCALDEGDDPLKDSGCHIKANPNLGIVIQQDYLDRQVVNAANIPDETNTVLRLNFCVWTQGRTAFFKMAKWRACSGKVTEAELVGRPCYGGIDLGETDDFCAWARLWDLANGRILIRVKFWIPEAALKKYPDRPYDQWQRAGLLKVTEGDIVDYDLVEEEILEDARASGVIEIGYDKRFAQQMAQHLAGADIEMVDEPQGFGLNEACRKFRDWVADEVLLHEDNLVLTWMADNTIVKHGPNKTIRLDKEASKEKIDGISAGVIATRRLIAEAGEETSAYDDGHGLLIV